MSEYEETDARLRAKLPACTLIAYRRGIFYELYGDDALSATRLCGLPTHRVGSGRLACGFPAHLVDTYLAKFIRNGRSVALAERKGNRWVYEITRLIEPGKP